MCYAAASDGVGAPVCGDPANQFSYSDQVYDCNKDDYFSPDPAPGSYLDTHWNLYRSLFFCQLETCLPALPETTITTGPPLLTNSNSVSFSFESSTAGTVFECRLDAGAYESCASPKSHTDLADGEHTFSVRARDQAGNVDPTPASRSFTIDTEPPETTITSEPPEHGNSSTVSFSFASSEPGGGFECRLDPGAYESCASPKSYENLADGEHTFSVRASDQAGNVDATPASRSFTIDTQPTEGQPAETQPVIAPPIPIPSTPAPARPAFDLKAAIRRCKKRFAPRARRNCIRKARARATSR